MSGPSHEQVDVTLNRLADLRIQIDMSLAEGKESAASRSLKSDFKTKFSELQNFYKDHLTEAEIRQLLIDKIQERQNIYTENKIGLKLSRADQSQRLIPDRLYRSDILNRISIPHSGRGGRYLSNAGNSFYNAGNDTFYYMSYRNLMAFSLKDGTLKHVLGPYEDSNNFVVTENAILVHAGFEHIFRIDLKTGERTELFKSEEKMFTIAKALSPSGSRIAIKDHYGIKFFNITDNSPRNIEFQLWSPPKSRWSAVKKFFSPNAPSPRMENYVDKFEFINDSLVLVSGTNGSKYTKSVIFNIETGEVHPTNLTERESTYFKFNRESGDILFLGESTIKRINIADIAQFETKAVSYPHIDFLRSSDIPYIATAAITQFSFISPHQIAVMTESRDSSGRVTLLVNLDNRNEQQVLRTEADGTKTMGVLYSDSASKRLFEIGAHRDVTDVNGYSQFFIDTWYRD
jgi:hypothetical protein